MACGDRFDQEDTSPPPVTPVTDPLGHTTTIAHDAHGNPTTITDARGKTTTLTYDSRGLLTSSRDPMGNLAQFG